MSTTIDSLQIEIQSNSTNASSGIDALAASLGNLKKQTISKTAISNLEQFSNVIKNFGNVHGASNGLRTLANSIEKLKSVGTLSSLNKSLTGLPDALSKLENIKLEGVSQQAERLAVAVAPLSNIKSGGLGSMVTAMGKLEKVTRDLKEEHITAFAEKVKRLDAVLGPASQKMTTLQAGFKGLNTAVKQTNVSIDQANAKVHVGIFNFSNLTNVLSATTHVIQQVARGFATIVDSATQWDGIAARFGKGFGAQAQETYEWIQRLNEEMGINVQQFMQYSSIYATMLTGFGVANEDAGKMALGYAELTYDIWAGYNDIYRSFDEAAEAVRSAIAGEVEPVRRAGFTIIESTLQQTAANHGLAISLETATEAQKSYLRYLTLVDQAHSQNLVGTYAKEMGTAEGLMRTLSQQLKSLAQAFGSLFIPILVKALPYVQAFVELLTEGVHWLANLFGIEIQDISGTWGDYNAGIGDSVDNTENLTGALGDANKAAKELKKATIGIDELNVISEPASSSGGGGGSGSGLGGGGFDGLDVDSLWDESIFKNVNDQVDKIKKKLKEWLPIVELIGGAFATLGIATLIAQMGEAMVKFREMDGMVGKLKGALAGLTILSIQALIVFGFADEYLETGDPKNLLGQAIATAAGGFLMYKGFGAKGLVFSLATSMIAQLVAITFNLADGGVEISDPQLWIQSAFATVLGGAAGGVLAYKGLIPMSTGKGIGLGVLAGASLTLAAITIGEITAKGEITKASIFTGLGSVLAAAGFGFTVGGAWGAVIGAVAAVAVNVGGAMIGTVTKDAEKKLEDDLKSRFGNIKLDSESLEVYVDKITAVPREVEIDGTSVPVTAALDIYVEEKATLDALEESVYNHLKKLDRLNIKIAVGVDVTQEEYQTQIDSFVDSAQGYLDQFYLTTNVAISILDNPSSGNLSSVLEDFYKNNSSELTSLGSKLKEAVSNAFVDGQWIPDKLQEALELQQEIQEILDYVSEVEYRATLENLSLSVSGDMLTPDSFKDVLSGAQSAIEERLNALEEVKMSQLQVAVMEYDANLAAGVSESEAKKIYDTTVADIEKAYQDGRVELTYGTVDFGLDTLRESFGTEIEKAKADGLFNFDSHLSKALTLPSSMDNIWQTDKGKVYGQIAVMASDIKSFYDISFASIDGTTRKNLKKLLKELEPTMADYEDIASTNREAGETVPEEIRNGLNDYNELAALSGDVDAINYLIGEGFSTDTTFLNTLATVEGAGRQIDESVAEGLLNNLSYVTDEATGLVTGIKNSITGEVIAVTPTLKSNMESLGVNLSTGVLEGAESEMQAQKKTWKDWAIWPWNWFKEKNEINSPSKVFERGGNYIVQGLVKGIGVNALKERLTTLWNNAKTWWDKSKATLKSYTPSIGSIYENLKERWDNARIWWNDKKTKAKEYTPSIGSIYEKVKERWDNARTWWNSKKSGMNSYTPSIGSIKDKIVSAWNTAKSWWNKNVGGLATKLNISIPKISIKWDTVSALGKEFRYPTGFKLSYAAEGGIFDQGSLVWAGERGPEIVANAAGGKTGVMNVEQMQDAVYEGVFAAITAAMSGKSEGGAQAVNVYLDGRQITAAVEQRQRERGASIMGSGVYSY
jgi:hypothetical protein